MYKMVVIQFSYDSEVKWNKKIMLSQQDLPSVKLDNFWHLSSDFLLYHFVLFWNFSYVFASW